MRSPASCLIADERGTSIVEFALIVTPLMMLLLGVVDVGFQQYIAIQLQGALNKAAREVTVGYVSQEQIQQLLDDRVHAIWPDAKVTLTPQTFDNFSHVAKPEPVTSDKNNNGTFDPGDCYLDVNGNQKWDAAVSSGKSGTGGGDDIVYYTAKATYPEIMPVSGFFGWSTTTTVSASMMMRNQPYAAQLQPATICT